MNWLQFWLALLILGLIPGPGVLAVVARTLTQGRISGAMMALGIALGDCIWASLALLGLNMLALALGGLFVWIQLAAALYLFWLAWGLWRSQGGASVPKSSKKSALFSGLLLCLSNPKPMFFYLGMLPTLVDFDALTLWHGAGVLLSILLIIATVLMGFGLVAYFGASKSTALGQNPWLKRLGALVLTSSGVWVLIQGSS